MEGLSLSQGLAIGRQEPSRAWSAALVSLLLLCIAPVTREVVAQQSGIDVRYLELQQGAIDEATFTRELLSSGAEAPNVSESLQTLRRYRDKVKQPANNIRLYREIAILAEMTAQYDVAAEHYQLIIDQTVANVPERYDALLRLAALKFNNGDLSSALAATQRVLLGATDSRQTHRAYILQTRIEGYTVDFTTAIQKLRWFIDRNESSPHLRLAYVTLAELYRRIGDDTERQRTEQAIARLFPLSVEAEYDAQGDQRIASLPLPVVLLRTNQGAFDNGHGHEHLSFGQINNSNDSAHRYRTAVAPANNEVIKIQTGSFANPEYAESLRTRLQALGLTVAVDAVSHGGETRHKVRVSATSANYIDILDLLSAHNIGSFIVD